MTALRKQIEYAFAEIRSNYDEWNWWRGRIEERLIHPFHANISPGYDDSIDIMEEDWDFLYLLDACRADLFEETVDTEEFDSYGRVRSQGSATPEWVKQNFEGESFGDTVYISANPFVSKFAGDSFHALVEVWDEAFDEESGTVPPNEVVTAARNAAEEYPNKRLIVHFMQPHYPFRCTDYQFEGWHPDEIVGNRGFEDVHTPWDALREGLVDRKELWDAYADNLDYVMEEVEELLDVLPGKHVITSDHGNMLGERGLPIPIRIYGHPVGLRFDELVEVPWATLRNGSRRDIVDDGARSLTESETEAMEERLQQLGYK